MRRLRNNVQQRSRAAVAASTEPRVDHGKSNSWGHWNGPSKIKSDDMLAMAVVARPGKTAKRRRRG